MTGRDRAPARPPAISSPAVASARADLHRAKQQLTELNVRLSLIAEQIHAGKVLLKTIRHDLIAAKRRSERTRVAAERAVDELDATVRRAYEGVGTTEGLAALIGSSSVSDLVRRVEYLSALAQTNARVATDAGEARRQAAEAAARTGSLAA